MALFQKNKSKNTPTTEQHIDMAPVDIYTLPSSFLPHGGKAQTGGTTTGVSKVTLVLIAMLLLILLGGIGAWLYFSTTTSDQQVVDDFDLSSNTSEIPDTTDTEVDTDTPVVQGTPPPPLTHIARDSSGAVAGIIELQLSAADKAVIDQIQIGSEYAVSSEYRIVTSAFRFTPSGLKLKSEATITIEYVDTALPSIVENSLRIAYLRSDGSWQLDDRSVLDLNTNTVSITIDQLPAAMVAIVSNLSQQSLPVDDVDTELPVYEVMSLKSSFDTDEDGLSDIEEIVYKTEFNNPDTDGDGYQDGAEVRNGYSPTTASETLLALGEMTQYTNPTYGYSVPYLSDWQVVDPDDTGAIIMFMSETNQFIQVMVEKKDTEIDTIDQWYKTQVPGIMPGEIRSTTIGPNAVPAIISIDGSVVYFIVGDYVYGIGYNKGIENEADYLATWEYMQKSFTVPGVGSTTTTVTDSDTATTTDVTPE